MSYVVVDLEWNQAMRSDSHVFNRLPIHLRGEIIEIGAVRLNDDMTPGEEFTIDVRPVYFRQIHYKVQKLTGFDKERLSNGCRFPEALKKFREFCGDDVTLLTWGADDQGILEQNIIIHDLDWDWIHEWINLQLIFNVQTGGDRNQKSLSSAMEYFSIEQTRVAHDALGDAYNTALVCSNLDMKEGFRTYYDASRILAERSLMNMPSEAADSGHDSSDSLSHELFCGYSTKADAFADSRVTSLLCPECEAPMQSVKWVNQGDGRYINLYSCKEHGKFLVRIKFKKDSVNETLIAARIVYEADDEAVQQYNARLAQARRRGRGHRAKNIHPGKH